MLLVSLLNYQVLLDQVHWMYIAAVASLMTVMLFGQNIWARGAGSNFPGGNTSSHRSGSS